MARPLTAILLALLLAGCRGERPGTASDQALRATVDSLVPEVEQAVGLQFSKPPRFAVRTKAQVSAYLQAKLDQEFPAAKVEGVASAYRLLDLIPDTLDIRKLLLGLYTEQVAGYYDPDSATLYAVEGAQGDQLRLVLAHELVHALQDEHLPLARMLKEVTNSDRLAASQAVLEGHATIAMLEVLIPDASTLRDPNFWQLYRDQIKTAQTSMPVFRSAPLVLQEGLIFPYLGGAEFMRWWAMQGKGPLPRPDELPRSSEQVLHPDRYASGDEPVPVRFAAADSGVLYEDTMGELELQVWTTVMRGGGEVITGLANGWGGDRFRVYRTADGPALVHFTVWDDSVAARRFAGGPAQRFLERPRAGYRTTVDRLSLDGHPAVRMVRAPAAWARWADLPTAELTVSPPAG